MATSSFWDRLRASLRREQADVAEALGDAEVRANEKLDRLEREQRATPEEKLAIEQERGAANDADFDAVRERIQRRLPPDA